MPDIFNTAAGVCFTLSIVLSALSVFLYFYLDIKKAWGVVSGRSARRGELMISRRGESA